MSNQRQFLLRFSLWMILSVRPASIQPLLTQCSLTLIGNITSITYERSKGQNHQPRRNKHFCLLQMTVCHREMRENPSRDILAPVSVATCLSGDSGRCDEAWAKMITQKAGELILWLTYSSLPPPPLCPPLPNPPFTPLRTGTLAKTTVYRRLIVNVLVLNHPTCRIICDVYVL